MPTTDAALQSQIRNIEATHDRTMRAWFTIIDRSRLTKHPDVIAMLKTQPGIAHDRAAPVPTGDPTALLYNSPAPRPASTATRSTTGSSRPTTRLRTDSHRRHCSACSAAYFSLAVPGREPTRYDSPLPPRHPSEAPVTAARRGFRHAFRWQASGYDAENHL